MDILLDNLTSFVGEFTLTEYKNGSSEILVQEKNMIMNRAKQSLAEMLSGAKMGEVGNAYSVQPINRFELGSGSHTGLVKIDPVNTLTKLRALTNQALGGALTTDADKQLSALFIKDHLTVIVFPLFLIRFREFKPQFFQCLILLGT